LQSTATRVTGYWLQTKPHRKMPETILLSIAVLLAALALSLALNGLFVKYGRKDRDPEAYRRIHVGAMGKQGGIAIYLTLVLVPSLISGAGDVNPENLQTPDFRLQTPAGQALQGVHKTVEGAKNVVPQILGLFLAATAIFLIGVADDRGGVRWRWKCALDAVLGESGKWKVQRRKSQAPNRKGKTECF